MCSPAKPFILRQGDQVESLPQGAYASLVRPIAKYASVAWSPHTAKDISAIESTQRRAARFVFNDFSRDSSVSAMLADLNWQSLEERRIINAFDDVL